MIKESTSIDKTPTTACSWPKPRRTRRLTSGLKEWKLHGSGLTANDHPSIPLRRRRGNRTASLLLVYSACPACDGCSLREHGAVHRCSSRHRKLGVNHNELDNIPENSSAI